jgi:hypothetical protein
MKAKGAISGASYPPAVVSAIGQAFDEVWADIGHHFGDDQPFTEKARLDLSHALFTVASETSQDVSYLKESALMLMSMNYPQVRQRGP